MKALFISKSTGESSLVKRLSADFHVIQISADPGTAAEAVQQNSPDIVLLYGFSPETAAAIRKRFSLNELPLFYIAENVNKNQLIQMFESGINDYAASDDDPDIVELKVFKLIQSSQAIQNTREGDKRYRLLADLTFEGIIIHRNGIVVDVNRAFCEICGYTTGELISRQALDLIIHPEDVPVVQEKIKLNVAEPYQVRLIKKDGSVVPVEIEARDFELKGEQLRVAAIRDINDRLKSERILRDSEERFRAVFKQAASGIVISDRNTQIIDANPAFADMVGIPLQEIRNYKVSEMTWPEDKEHDLKRLKDILEHKKTNLQLQKRFRHSDGRPVWTNVALNITEETDTEPLRIYLVVTDITARIEAELRLKEALATKNKFFSIIAHDLKNPFQGLLSLTDLLVKDFDSFEPASVKEMIKKLHYSAENTFELLQNLLDWSRSQTNSLPFEPVLLNIKSLLENEVKQSAPVVEKKNIHLNFSVEPEYLEVKADKNMLITILRNLINNSVKFTKPGGSVDIIAKQQGTEILFEVRDTGVGISSQNQNKLFKPDHKISTKGTDAEEGTGLGLFLCKEFAEKHGGKLYFESEPGRGSRFFFTIPDQKA